MIRRNFLKAITAVFCGSLATKKASGGLINKSSNFVPAMALPSESVISIRLSPGCYYWYDNSQVILQVSEDVKLGEPLYQGKSGKITNNASGDGYSSFIGTAMSHSDPDRYCKVQLARLI